MATLPTIIQGGMGAGVSGWRLARSVAEHGQMGVVSGTALDCILVRVLQTGDPGGHYRRALAAFPFPDAAEAALAKWFVEGGLAPGEPFARMPLPSIPMTRERSLLVVLAAFAEVWLAKEGHDGLVGLNLLEKIQFPNLETMHGAMLAGVDAILVGAGIPFQFPGAIDRLARHEPAALAAMVEAPAGAEATTLAFDPSTLGPAPPPLSRPLFLPIISSPVLAQALLKRATGRIDGFVVEGPTAGGHNAPPRGPMKLDERGEPVYGPRDAVDWEAMRKLGLPFWIAGSCGSPERVREATDLGAAGVQVGTLFALCAESGLRPDLKDRIRGLCAEGKAEVFTDPLASPTGFPFKVVDLEGTLSRGEVHAERDRRCDLGYLRQAYLREDGAIGWRCPAEPAGDYARKGGDAAEAEGRKCLCNALMANIGLGQSQPGGYDEPALVTIGSGVAQVEEFLRARGPQAAAGYSSAEVLDYLLGN